MPLSDDLRHQLLDWLRDPGVPILLIIGISLVVIRLARLFVHGVVKALLDREATEGTAQELSGRSRSGSGWTRSRTLGTNVIRPVVPDRAG